MNASLVSPGWHSAAHRDARIAVAVSWNRRGLTRGAVNYTGFPRSASCARSGVSVRGRPGAASRCSCWSLRLCGDAASIGDRSCARTPSGSPRPARDTRAFRSSGAWRSVYFLSGLMASMAAIIYVAHLGQARSDAGIGLRARRDHRRGAGRNVGVRRARHNLGNARSACSPCACCRTACSWPRCRRS